MNQKLKTNLEAIEEEMLKINQRDPKCIFHYLKVHSIAKEIAESEKLNSKQKFVVESAALMHDIGIKRCEELYGSTAGKLQEKEGPRLAREILEKLELPKDIIDNICFLISKHHTYSDINGIEWQILIEADFIVNAFEENWSKGTIEKFKENYFKTIKGLKLLEQIYG